MDSEERPQAVARGSKRAWEPPTWLYVGDVEDVIQQGEGKISVTAADPGESKKTKPSG
jgi:hypothetical protein